MRSGAIPNTPDPIILVDGGYNNGVGSAGGVVFLDNKVLIKWNFLIQPCANNHYVKVSAILKALQMVSTLCLDKCHIDAYLFQLINDIHALSDSSTMGLWSNSFLDTYLL